MWICPKCGEPHQDQFKDCWKCVGAEMEEHVTAELPKPLPPGRERRLRSLRSILLRAAIGFVVGLLVSLSSLKFIDLRSVLPAVVDISPTNRVAIGLIGGALCGILVGLFFWVALPYEPSDAPVETSNRSE
jgi:hypothetical protein